MNRKKRPLETELKMVLPSQDAEQAIVSRMREHGYTIDELDTVRNVDIYLDTFDWSLLKKKLALRYRIAGGVAMYTVKSLGKIEDGIASRMETEVTLGGPVESPAEVPVKQIRKIIDGLIYPRRLLEHVQVRTNRRRYRIFSPEGAEIELAFDTSSFSPRGLHKMRRARSLHELEAEIMKGPQAALPALSHLLSREFGYPPSTASKQEIALDRLKIPVPSKKPPEKLRVRFDDRLDLAVRKILNYQLDRFRELVPGIQGDIDTEFVHQARVATRRMRSAIRLFRDAIPRSRVAYFSGELRWLGGLLGQVRDLDVFLLNLAKFRQQIDRFPANKKKAFDNWIEKHRRAPLKALSQALESRRYRNLVLRLDRFFAGPLAARPGAPLAVKLVKEIAPVVISERFTAVIEQGRRVLENPKIGQFHRLRIQMKRLRYACEFMAPAYDGALDQFIDGTVEIQDCLGEIQDTVFTREFINYLFDDWKLKLVNPELVFILGEIYQLQTKVASERQASFSGIWERFASPEAGRQLEAILFPQAEADA